MFNIGDIVSDGTDEYVIQDVDALTEPIPKYLVNDKWQFCVGWGEVVEEEE